MRTDGNDGAALRRRDARADASDPTVRRTNEPTTAAAVTRLHEVMQCALALVTPAQSETLESCGVHARGRHRRGRRRFVRRRKAKVEHAVAAADDRAAPQCAAGALRARAHAVARAAGGGGAAVPAGRGAAEEPAAPAAVRPALGGVDARVAVRSRVRPSRLVVKGGNPYTTRGFIANTRGVIATCLVTRTVADEPSAALVAVSNNGIGWSPEACGRVGTSTSYTSSSSRSRPAARRLTPQRPPSPPPPIANASRGGSAPACVDGARRRAAGRRPRRRRRTASEAPSSSASSSASPPQKSATGCRAAPRAGVSRRDESVVSCTPSRGRVAEAHSPGRALFSWRGAPLAFVARTGARAPG